MLAQAHLGAQAPVVVEAGHSAEPAVELRFRVDAVVLGIVFPAGQRFHFPTVVGEQAPAQLQCVAIDVAAVFRTPTQPAGAQQQVGGISINDACLTGMVQTAEKQSFKLSGMGGSRMGTASIRRFVRARALLINNVTASPWWFPPAA